MEKNQYELEEDAREQYREDLFESVRAFENKYKSRIEEAKERGRHSTFLPPSKAALYNYALSLLNVEFYKLTTEDRELVLKEYS